MSRREYKDYKTIKVWVKADKLFDMVCEDVKRWPRNAISNAICYQLLDAVGSVSANIVEGYGRGIPGEFEQFLRYARGSAAETDNWLFKAFKNGFITQGRYEEYQAILTEINKMIGSFIKSLRNQPRKKFKS